MNPVFGGGKGRVYAPKFRFFWFRHVTPALSLAGNPSAGLLVAPSVCVWSVRSFIHRHRSARSSTSQITLMPLARRSGLIEFNSLISGAICMRNLREG